MLNIVLNKCIIIKNNLRRLYIPVLQDAVVYFVVWEKLRLYHKFVVSPALLMLFLSQQVHSFPLRAS